MLILWLFSDKSKFKVVNEDPTLRNLSTVQNYLNNLFSRGEITEEQKKEMRLKFSHIVRAHGLPKIHKQLDRTPSFLPIVDTRNTLHYEIGQFLAKLLNILTQNEYTVKDSFEEVDKIHKI